MQLQHIRHATHILQYQGIRLLVDPVFAAQGAMSPIPGVPDTRPVPLTPLPLSPESLTRCDAVLLTHLHRDHFDDAAAAALPRHLPLFCQPCDAPKLRKQGFTDIRPVRHSLTFQGLTLTRFRGRHGHGVTAIAMGTSSGYVLECADEPPLMITGDTVWCAGLQKALARYQPQCVVCYAGAATFSSGKPITLDGPDLLRIAAAVPRARLVLIHMDTWNHCRLSRRDAQAFCDIQLPGRQTDIPADGEVVPL